MLVSTSSQTDETIHGSLPPYTANVDPGAIEQAMQRCHPRLLHEMVYEGTDPREDSYAQVANALGTRCHVIENELQVQKDSLVMTGKGEYLTIDSFAFFSIHSYRSLTFHLTLFLSILSDHLKSASSSAQSGQSHSVLIDPNRFWVIPAGLVAAVAIGYMCESHMMIPCTSLKFHSF